MKRRLLVVLALCLIGTGLFFYEVVWAPNVFDGDRFVIVSKGENFSQVLDSLQKAGVIRSRALCSLAGRLYGYTTKIQVGKYRIRSGMSNHEILLDFRHGTTVEFITVVIPEGRRAVTVAKLFAKELGIDSSRFVGLANDTSVAKKLGVDARRLEGYLMPETYVFDWQTDEDTIVTHMVGEFRRTFSDTLVKRASALGLTVNQVLAIASIIEGETSIDSERAVISGVYHNRLKRHMPLQADPTVQYIIGNGPRRLTLSDLHIESPYNTYRHIGLPPGPINNPGRAAILAALYPKKHRYLFFVANGKGGHQFSKTFAEHKKAIRQYRKWMEEQEAAKRDKQGL